MKFHRTKITLLAASMGLILAGCSSSDDPAPTLSPTASVSASASSIARGGKVTLTWFSTNADSCTASGDWSGDKGTSGSEEVGPLRKDSSYTLACSGNGETNANTATVAAGPVIQPTTYADFPVTLMAAVGDTSVSYKGQMSRGVLRESAKAATKGNATGIYEAGLLAKYINNENNVIDDQPILAPKTKGNFIIKEIIYNELGTGRNLAGKLYDTDKIYRGSTSLSTPMPGVSDANKNVVHGMPGAMTAKDVIDLWTGKFEALNAGNTGTAATFVDMQHGYDYNQLFPKFLMGALFYYQTVNLYLDEFMDADSQPNNLPYSNKVVNYTGKEHSWDEGFGYFGASASYGEQSGKQRYYIKKMGKTGDPGFSAAELLAVADKDGDGAVSLYTEYNSGSAYYAGLFDKDTATTSSYGDDIMDAFLAGRTLIANAVDTEGNARALTDTERTALRGYATTVQRNWEMVFAEAVHRYAGLSHQKLAALELVSNEANQKDYYKMWAEMKGFMLALQYGGTAHAGSNPVIDLTKFTDIDGEMGFGPVLENNMQVTGITAGNYVLTDQGAGAFAAYKDKLKAVQTKLDTHFNLQVKLEPIP